MGIQFFEVSKLKEKNYRKEKVRAQRLGVKSLDFHLIKQRRNELNSRRFRSEIWFQEKLEIGLKSANVCIHKNYNILNRFFADFLIFEKNIVIEVDGSSHDGKDDYDRRRDELFKRAGYIVYRVKAYDNHAADRLILTLRERLQNFTSAFLNKKVRVKKAKKQKKHSVKQTNLRFKDRPKKTRSFSNFCPTPDTFHTPRGRIFPQKYFKAWSSYNRAGLDADKLISQFMK